MFPFRYNVCANGSWQTVHLHCHNNMNGEWELFDKNLFLFLPEFRLCAVSLPNITFRNVSPDYFGQSSLHVVIDEKSNTCEIDDCLHHRCHLSFTAFASYVDLIMAGWSKCLLRDIL